MAIITPTLLDIEGSAYIITWENMANGDVGEPVQFAGAPDRSAHVHGTFGAGGSVSLQGSNEPIPSNYATLNDPFGNAATLTAAGIKAIGELVRYIRPSVTAGDGTTSLTVRLLVKV